MSAIRTEAAGATFSFRTISGEVVGTDQRSDSYTTGSSRTVIYDGSGGGSGHVDTEVVVNRDIWIRDGRGQEHHVRIATDVPVRVGQHLAFVYLQADRPATPRAFDGLVTVYVLSTDRYWATRPLGTVAKRLVRQEMTPGRSLGILVFKLVCVALVFSVIGIPLLVLLIAIAWIRAAKREALAAEIAKAMEASQLEVLRVAYSAFRAEQARLADAAATSPRAIGAAS